MADGWNRYRLGDVLDLALDRVVVCSDSSYDLAGVYSFGRGLFRREPLRGDGTSYKHLNRLHTGNFVMSKLKAWEGAVTVIGSEFEGAVLSPEFPTYAVKTSVLLPRYLSLLTRHPPFWGQLATVSTGMGGRKERVHQTRVLEVEVDLPRIEQQRRIVDLVAAVDSAIDRARQLTNASSNLYFAQLTRIFEQLLAESALRPLGEVAESRLGKMLSKASKTGGAAEYPYVRNADVQWDEIRLETLNRMEFSDKERDEFSLRAGDVLVCEGGEVGRAAVVESDLDGIYFQKAIHRVRCHSVLEPRFLMHFLRFCSRTGGFADLATAMTIQHLTGEKLRRLVVPVPSIRRQQALTDELDALGRVAAASNRLAQSGTCSLQAMLGELLSGAHEVPTSYDQLLGLAS